MRNHSLFLCIATFFCSFVTLEAQNCECTNCPQFMQDLFVGDFNLNIQGATNNTLGQNGQGVCGVIVHFDHTAICDISITLTSPSGQAVTLVGPIGQFCTSNGNAGTDWNVTFLPCGGGAVPDPGFNAQWNNNQPWGANNAYSGSYYPFGGCLENFSGPVNGNWVLTVIDGQANDTGNLFDFEIIFCDPSGINCVSCAADAGSLPQPNVVSCQGEPTLALDLPPDYNAPAVQPPSSEYSYTYLIGGAGGIIQSITASPDLTGFPVGNYTVCGLSYLSAHQNLLPTPNGTLTVMQLTNQLNSNIPPFCGNVTSNCVNVLINPIPPDETETAVICAPDCYEFLGQFYCATGVFTVDQMDANGCHYDGILYLTVNTPTFQTINEIVCPGGCSTNPSFLTTCDPGQYQITLINQKGCDSILTLNLTEMAINAVIQPPPMLTCVQNTVQLSGVGSTVAGGVTYLWTASNGGSISGLNNMIFATAASAGTYKLLVCRTIGSVTCCDSATVNVTSNIVLPNAPVISGSNTICQGINQLYTVLPVASATAFNWTVPAGVSILSGQGGDSIIVQWNSAMGGNICVTANNACGPSPQTCLTVTPLNTPIAPVLQGDTIVCQDSIVVYSADSMVGVDTFYWQITGGVILGGNGTDSILVQWNGGLSAGTVCATASNNCGIGPVSCLNVTVNAVPALPQISGDSTRCTGTTGNYAITALNGASAYIWTVPVGATIVSGQGSTSIVVSWAAAPGGNVCVQGINDCGAGLQQCFPVVVSAQPSANAGPDNAICGISINLAATASVLGSMGVWTSISGPGTATFANVALANTNVFVTPAGLYQFQWTETNGQCADADTVQIAFNAAPATGMVQASCDGANQNYTISFPVSGGSPPYSVVGGAILNGVFTSSAIPNGQSYLFSIVDANGCSSPAISGVFNCNCATNAGQMNLQLLSACPGNNVTAQASQGANLETDDIGAFVLHSNSGVILGTIYGENTTGTFSFVNGMSYGTTYYISFVVGNNLNGLPDLMDPCLSITPGQPVIFYANPVVNAGLDVSGCGLTLMTNATVVPGNGLWTVTGTPAGGSVNIANAQNAVTGVTASIFGVYTLTYTVTDNGCIGTDNVLLSFGDAPTAGPVSTVCDGANLEYLVSFVISDGLAPFTVNSQAVAGTQFTSAPIPSGNSYNFVIQDANGCFSTAVTGSFSCNCTTSAGQISTTPLTVCQSDSITVQVLGGQNLDADDVTSFVLHTGSGPALGTVLFQNHTGRFGYWATMDFGTTYYVSVVAGNNLNGFPDPNDMCLSVSPGQPIIFVQNPIPDAGDDFLVCGLTANLPATPGAFGGTWTQVSGPGTINFSDIQNPKSSVVSPLPGIYMLEWVENNGLCSASDDIMVNFLALPAIGTIAEVCNGTNTGYTLNFTVNNGTGTININGLAGTFNGTSFTSAELPNNSSYTFTVQDAFGCQSLATNGDHFCACSTFAGTMNASPLVFCADAMATASWNNDATFDADDAVQYILHDQPGGNMGTVFATNTQPVFSFGPGLQTGTTYYISAIAGSIQAGIIDLNDPCLDISAGTPVQWKALPFATLLGDATICNGSSTVLNFNGTGAYPLQLLYTDGSGTPVALTIPGPQTIPRAVSPTASTTYTLLSITDGSIPTCSANLNASITVQVNQPVDAGVAEPALERCTGIAPGIALGDLITGEDSGGQWTETSTIPSVLNAFNAINGAFNTNGQAAGTYTFRYNLPVALPCPSQSTTITVILHPTPVADAGEDQLIDCHQDSVILGGSGTSIGNGIMYSWALAGTEIATTPSFSTGQGGDYSLLTTSTFGCSDTDNATIMVDNDIPFAAVIETNAVKCFGDTNGSILLDSIVSGHQPVVFSLNGGPFEAVHQYEQLAPGTYVVTLLDNNGCEWNTDSLVVLEPPLMTVDLGGEINATFGDSVFLKASASVPLAELESLTWTPLFDSIHANTFIQDFLPLISTYVNIELVDSSGCKASSRVLVRVQRPKQVYIPNVFKPGSGSMNDQLTVYGGRGVAEIESFRIFDRWGDQLFESLNFQPNDPIIGWNGTHRGDMVLPGVYVYFAVVRFIDGEVELYKGDVTVVR